MQEEYRTGLSFSVNRRRVLVFRCTLRALGMPENIRFLLNMKQKKIAVQACEAIDRDHFKVPEESTKGSEQYEITSLKFLEMIYRIAGWNNRQTYRLQGTVYPDNRLVEFDLLKAEVISEEEFVDSEVKNG